MIKNTASQVVHFGLVSATDGSAMTTGSPSVYVTLDGGTQAAGGGGTPVHEGNGQWSYTPTQAETNADSVGFLFTLSGAIPASIQIYTVAAAVDEAVAVASATGSTLIGHMTELDAINAMLDSIGESAVSSLSSGQIDAETAARILARSSRQIQSEGWHANTRRNVTLTTNASNQFAVGVNVISIDAVNPKGARMTSTPAHSGFYNVMLKRAADNSKWLLYDVDNDSETWTDISSITVDIIEYLQFDFLPATLQEYIFTHAAHQFQQTTVASQVLNEFSREDVANAAMRAIQDDMKNEDSNILRDNRHSWEVVYRYNPTYGT